MGNMIAFDLWIFIKKKCNLQVEVRIDQSEYMIYQQEYVCSNLMTTQIQFIIIYIKFTLIVYLLYFDFN